MWTDGRNLLAYGRQCAIWLVDLTKCSCRPVLLRVDRGGNVIQFLRDVKVNWSVRGGKSEHLRVRLPFVAFVSLPRSVARQASFDS